MSNTKMTFRELIELIETSVESGKISNDYPDFMKCCQDLGISSYVLNLLIQKGKENQKVKGNNNFDYAFFVDAKPKKEIKEEEHPLEPETIVKIETRTSKTAWWFVLLLLLACIAEGFANYELYKERNSLSTDVSLLSTKNTELHSKLKSISDMTSKLSDDSSFSSWQSTNHDQSSESHVDYNFKASEGDKLSFSYYTSSEANFDFLTVTLTGDNLSSPLELVKASGDTHKSKSYTFAKSGSYNINIKYKKDSSIDKNNDNAGVTDICIHKNYKSLLDSINVISNVSSY